MKNNNRRKLDDLSWMIRRNFDLQYKENKPYLFELQKYNELNKLINYANGLYKFFDKRVLCKLKGIYNSAVVGDLKIFINKMKEGILVYIRDFYDIIGKKNIKKNNFVDYHVNYGSIAKLADDTEKFLLNKIILNVDFIKQSYVLYSKRNLLQTYAEEIMQDAKFLVDNLKKKYHVIYNKQKALYALLDEENNKRLEKAKRRIFNKKIKLKPIKIKQKNVNNNVEQDAEEKKFVKNLEDIKKQIDKILTQCEY